MICKTILKNYDEKEILHIKSPRIYYFTFKMKILPQIECSNGKEVASEYESTLFSCRCLCYGGTGWL